MGLLDGKVALITGGARGQGRAHALRLAEEGAQIVVCDIADQIASVPYPLATKADLDDTQVQVEALDQRCLAVRADARSSSEMNCLVDTTLAEFGRLDIVVVNHGIGTPAGWDATDEQVDDLIATNLKGAFNICRAAIPHMVAGGRGGSIVLTGSVAALGPVHGLTPYVMVKHGLMGLMRNLAAELAQHWIRVNAVCPGMVDTPMVMNDTMLSMFSGKQTGGTRDEAAFGAQTLTLLPTPWLAPEDISHAVLWLVSDQARFVTGVALPVDLGTSIQPAGVPPIASQALAAAAAQQQGA